MGTTIHLKRPITQPYPEEVITDATNAWEAEKHRLEHEEHVTIPKNIEPLVRRVFIDGFVSALNDPPF